MATQRDLDKHAQLSIPEWLPVKNTAWFQQISAIDIRYKIKIGVAKNLKL